MNEQEYGITVFIHWVFRVLYCWQLLAGAERERLWLLFLHAWKAEVLDMLGC